MSNLDIYKKTFISSLSIDEKAFSEKTFSSIDKDEIKVCLYKSKFDIILVR